MNLSSLCVSHIIHSSALIQVGPYSCDAFCIHEEVLYILGTFESEANQLRRIAGHKCIISPPAIQILNFSDDSLQTFFKSIPPQKQTLLKELFVSGGCMEAYVYPLYGVTMATKIKVWCLCMIQSFSLKQLE